MPKVGYIAYIDESGDDGLRRIRPYDPNGASEWFVLSAIIVRVERETQVLPWVRNIVASLNQHQRRDLHFRDLNDAKRMSVCKAVAELPIRCFVAMSHKHNMKGYKNPNAEKVPARNWFYCWMTRLLLERVTDYCERRSMRDFGEPRTVRLEFSERGGMSYSQFRAYMTWLRMQSRSDSLYLTRGDLKWSVVDIQEVYSYNHKLRAGLQIADTVASAFFQAVETNSENSSNPAYAKLLESRMCLNAAGFVFDYGVKVMPWFWRNTTKPHQHEVFGFYIDEDKKRQAPGPRSTGGD